MANRIRLGFVGASPKSGWASKSHFPALKASPDFELTAVCTTNPASAEEARKALGAKLAFSDYREMVTSPEIDAVTVVVRVVSHYAPTMAALEAGKHVYTEWPLGRITEEAEQMAALARRKGLQTAVGLQSRVSPALLYMKELVETGYIGDVLSCNVSTVRVGPLERPSRDSYKGDAANGANVLTIKGAHVIDTLRFVVGDFASLGTIVSTQLKQWVEKDTGKKVDVTSPDTVLLNGYHTNGAVASINVTTMPWAPSGYRMEIYGTQGTLIASSTVSSNHGDQDEMLKLKGAQQSHELRDLPIPERYTYVTESFPRGTPFNVGQMYALFADAIRTGKTPPQLPTFDTALDLHRLLDTIKQSSDARRMVPTVNL